MLLLVMGAGGAVSINAKVEYLIGGWLPGTPENMLLSVRPLFEDYLNENVGKMYNPKISFKLIPVDFSPETDSDPMMNQGNLDFICEKSFDTFLLTVYECLYVKVHITMSQTLSVEALYVQRSNTSGSTSQLSA